MQRTSSPARLAGGKPAEREDFILRRRHRLACARLPPTGSVLLDFGCGNGAQTRYFAPHFSTVIGADVSRSYLAQFRRHVTEPASTIAILYDGYRLPLATASVDYAISFEVLEHVRSESQALKELQRVVRPGGSLAMSVPNRWWIFETHGADLPLLPWHRVPLFSWLPRRIHDKYARARIYRRRDIVRKIEAHGFEVLDSTYVTAPMDALRWRSLRDALRATVFRSDATAIPVQATAILVCARRR